MKITKFSKSRWLSSLNPRHRVRIRKGTAIRHAKNGRIVAIFFSKSGECREFVGELADDKRGLWREGRRFGEYFEEVLPLRRIKSWFYEP